MTAETSTCCDNKAQGSACCANTQGKEEPRRVSDQLSREDKKIRRRLRWGIGRNNSIVIPGLYAVGDPGKEAPVFVSANYRMSFDYLRTSMPGRDFWILVLDTKGINVWCAAGKGTFGTREIIRQVEAAELSNRVDHRTLILPQLGAPGVEAHIVRKECGFKVIYGPVLSEDIQAFIDNGMKAGDEMRRVKFTLKDRAVLTPVELVHAWKALLIVVGYVFLFHVLRNRTIEIGVLYETLLFIGGIAAGAFFAPLLLPWVPGRSLALKGWITGLIVTAAGAFFVSHSPLLIASYFLLVPALSSFITMNFTGSTTYTSLSGVVKEMGVAVPLHIAAVSGGTAIMIAKIFI